MTKSKGEGKKERKKGEKDCSQSFGPQVVNEGELAHVDELHLSTEDGKGQTH